MSTPATISWLLFSNAKFARYDNGTTSDTDVSVHELQVASILVACGAALLVYDFFLILSEEIEYIWKRNWSLVSVLFILARYTPFLDTTLFLIRQFQPYPSPRICMLSWHVVVWCYLVSLAIVEVILILRTYAIWEHNRLVAFILLFMAIGSFGAAVWFSQEYLKSLSFERNPFDPDVLPGCYIKSVNNIAYACYSILLGHETVIFILTAARAIYQKGFGKSFIATVVYRDGLFYYTFILISTIATITLMINAPGTLATSITPLHRTLHTILAQRLVLNIRKAAATTASPSICSSPYSPYSPHPHTRSEALHTFLYGEYVLDHRERSGRHGQQRRRSGDRERSRCRGDRDRNRDWRDSRDTREMIRSGEWATAGGSGAGMGYGMGFGIGLGLIGRLGGAGSGSGFGASSGIGGSRSWSRSRGEAGMEMDDFEFDPEDFDRVLTADDPEQSHSQSPTPTPTSSRKFLDGEEEEEEEEEGEEGEDVLAMVGYAF